jgi:hypothetical protein
MKLLITFLICSAIVNLSMFYFIYKAPLIDDDGKIIKKDK